MREGVYRLLMKMYTQETKFAVFVFWKQALASLRFMPMSRTVLAMVCGTTSLVSCRVVEI